ncbi:bifunctional demethylmenaquinone methyltransferase/2-methoxy-6-polyprenyl-1,4-benzoquinol methylase [Desulfuribacillus stibiiarsenatis]|uniref:Demethylmenaquinone methyltransferase n=1 Tax=Desulfuribacillus stibiiarsenatis TaxID=1390249 RepID=A0A1E5L703_9FIRM|nr:demethylmenaquinone methyltransferase [Desulfuribacillus stibiiarsenatis]OEH85906.1 bifunctional demethylmenaquinone methyltransferase/2-methoxy-6-polyprenyl-1,4-benzoquinol methylase [Desulfuribacillus stibiiarsenatis]
MQQQKKEELVHSVFSSIASKYDIMNTILSFNRHKAWRKFTMGKMNVKKGQSAIDLCTGTGDWALSLAQSVGSQGRIVGLDFCESMLDVAEKKIAESKYRDVIELIHGNAMEIPFDDNSFDFATIGFALRNVPDIKQVLSEMQRVVKPGGKVVSLELSKPTWPPFRSLYYLYFNHLLPIMGKLAVGKAEPYQWLPESLKNFPDHIQLKNIFEELNMDTEVYQLTGGIVALHIGTKRNNIIEEKEDFNV